MRRIEIEFMGEKKVVFAEKRKGVLWFHINGETYSYQKQSARGQAAGASADPGKVLAPMPGRVTQVLCSQGSKVEAGQALMVMEAMKMEYTLEAAASGVIAKVNAKVDDQVEQAQILIELDVAE